MRLAVVRDYRAEGWPSMDLCADQLLAHVPATITTEDISPPFRRLFSRLPFSRRAGFNADRLFNRHLWLPRAVRHAAERTHFVHIVDHSYAHLVTAASPGRAGVYCHDLDAFRSLLEPDVERRPWWFRWLAGRILSGLKQAAVVFHSTLAMGHRLVAAGIVPPERLLHAPYGVASEFSPQPRRVDLPIGLDGPFLLHVGNNIPRKRMDVLLDVFAAVRPRVPGLHLIQVGGPWPPEYAVQIARLGIGQYVDQARGLTREQLAELYRRAAAVVVPSEAEGFGLPVIEALACGAPVIASDIPTLREAGGDAAIYCPVGDIMRWAEALSGVLLHPSTAPSREARLAHISRFSWREHARIIGEAYLALADRQRHSGKRS